MDTLDDLSILRESPLAEALAKFEELITQNGRAFLIGAGCSKCAGLPLTQELTDEVLKNSRLDKSAYLAGVRSGHWTKCVYNDIIPNFANSILCRGRCLTFDKKSNSNPNRAGI